MESKVSSANSSRHTIRRGSLAVRCAGAAAAVACLLAAGAAQAATAINDATGDFLSTFTGPHDGDLDVTSVSAVLSGTNVILTATVNGMIGTTANASYVWGIDRGKGTARFGVIGPGIIFDSVVFNQLTSASDGSFTTAASVLSFAGNAVGTDSVSVSVSGSTITDTVPLSDLVSNGFDPTAYGYSFWPRAGNGSIADFAPDASTFSVPEPATWAMLIMGFGLVGLTARRRKPAPVAA